MKALSITRALLLVVALLAAAWVDDAPQAQEGRKKAYDFRLKDLDGKTHSLSDFRGKVVIVDIWDTWCPPCRREIPEFAELHRAYADSGFVMIGVAAARNGVDAVRSFVREHRVPYLNLIATDEVFRGYGPIEGIPTTFVIDHEGYIHQKYVGYTPKQMFERDIKTLLARRKKMRDAR
ncbi:MAG: TlpA family protein disulfide reductase [candidate division KSB1 bacterium]|nr:TlpA family protein disulfide reductase [candidate division KSB1 bacterium]MDZ7393307.1 TlpA family protein disulfide reductase [candidate division KSB1 bacterium]MDZ7413157.1 TlpA family protein disulfide reductase [candidate division KSB1 bacterium]